jgi:transporter family protein
VAKVAPLDKRSVVFVILLAALFLKEKIGLQQIFGGVLILVGAVVLAWKKL